MAGFVKPKVFLIGYTCASADGILDYLKYTEQEAFMDDFLSGVRNGLSQAECLCSLYAKLCYKSLTPNKNENISAVRDIESNLQGTFDSAHGSVFEHASVNFIATDVSRVLTHELVRQRAGWAYSQTSGRYVRSDSLNIVWDDILKGCEDIGENILRYLEHQTYLMECRKGLRMPPAEHPAAAPEDYRLHDQPNLKWISNKKQPMAFKKKVTSAIRRFLPNGQSNEIGFTVNFRALRHFVQLRSGRHAEWEIREVTNQVYQLLKVKFPLLFYGAKEEVVDGLLEITGMRMQPYEIDLNHPDALRYFSTTQLEEELAKREDDGNIHGA